MIEEPADRDGATVQRVLALKTFPMLARLGADDLAAIAERARRVELPQGTILADGRETPETVHLVLEGEVEEGGDSPRRRRGPCVVGALEALSGRAGPTVVAASDLLALGVGAMAPLWELLEERFDLVLVCLANLARAARSLRRRLVPSGGHSAPVGDGSAEAPTTLAAQVAAMRRIGPLGGAPVHPLGLLACEGTLGRVERGHRLWSIEDEADRVLVLLAGRARASSREGHAFELGAGCLVGTDDALADASRWYDLTAASPLCFLDLPVERLLDVLEDDWAMTEHVLRFVARDLAALRARPVGDAGPREMAG